MAWGKPTGLSAADKALKAKIDLLREIEKSAFASRARFRERPWLQAVYRQYCHWADKDDQDGKDRVKNRTKRLLLLYKIDARKGRDLIRILIDISSQENKLKKKSRWANALRAARKRNVSAKHLENFFAKPGGVAGAADLA